MKKILLVLQFVILSIFSCEGQNSMASVGDVVGIVNKFYIYNGSLYAGGQGLQNNINNYLKNYIMKWDGANWDTVGGDLSRGGVSIVESIIEFNNELYIGGYFPNGYVLKFNGNDWVSVDNGLLDHEVVGLEVFNFELFAVENWNSPHGSDSITYIAKFDGTSWTNVGYTKLGNFECIKSFNNELYVGGDFYNLNDDSLIGNDIVRWDGTNWHSVAGGTEACNTTVSDFAILNNKLIASGEFSTIGGILTVSVGEWDGLNWTGFQGVHQKVGASAVYNNQLYISERFYTTHEEDQISVFNNYTAQFVDTSFTQMAYDIIFYNNELYISGYDMDGFGHSVLKMSLINGITNLDTKKNKVKINPNPTVGRSVNYQCSEFLNNATLIISNCLGQTVKEINNINENSIELHIENFESGIYFIHLIEDNKTVSVYKLIID